MAITKNISVFDPSDTSNDNIGAYLRSSDGTLLTHTTDGGKEALDVHLAGTDLTDVDIRDITHVSDSIKVGDGTDFLEITAAGEALVSATDFDIRDLTHASDSVKVGDGTEFLAINADGSINVVGDIEIGGYGSCTNPAAVSITTSATQLLASPLAGRQAILVQNAGGTDCYLGCDNSVTTAKGILLPKKASVELMYDDTVDLHAITASSTTDIRIMEAG